MMISGGFTTDLIGIAIAVVTFVVSKAMRAKQDPAPE